MKHLFSLLTVLCLAVSAMAQVDIDSFDKNPRQWDNISCSSAIVDNPYQTGLNLSCRCLQIVRAPECDN